MAATYIKKIMHNLQCAFKKDNLHTFGQLDGLSKTYFSDTIKAINVKFSWWYYTLSCTC